MRATILFLLLIFSITATCQTPQEAGNLYAHNRYTDALDMAFKLLKNENTAAFANGLIGRIYVDQEKYDKAIPYLQVAISLDNNSSYISGWSYACLGVADTKTGKREKGISELKKTIELNQTRNSVVYAQRYLDMISTDKNSGHTPPEPHWIIIEGTHIIYYFQDTNNIAPTVSQYIKQHEDAYVKINEVFKAILPKKMIFHIWSDQELARQILRRELGFTDPEACNINTAINQTIGHEMTHALVYWAWGYKPKETTRFINEGVAVAFDQSNRDKIEMARKAIAGKDIHSVLDIWNDKSDDGSLTYPVGGAFLTYLYKKCTPEQFKKIIKDQTVESVRNTLGIMQFDVIIAEFDKTIGFK